CNGALRERLKSDANNLGVTFLAAPPKYCTDNAAMIAGFANALITADVMGDDLVTTPFTRNPQNIPLPFPHP
ncbi:MAG: hypothetical protein GXP32_08710, partial [Kiritimatiellaeota bacterium]|nr:hypothetical protein [Kiritimatiellota bacterium]